MKSHVFGTIVFVSILPSVAHAQKDALAATIDARADQSWKMAQQIWEWAETGYKETRSATLLADALEKAGVKIERGVAKIPTALTASIAAGKPVIGILGRYDAPHGLPQGAVTCRITRFDC